MISHISILTETDRWVLGGSSDYSLVFTWKCPQKKVKNVKYSEINMHVKIVQSSVVFFFLLFAVSSGSLSIPCVRVLSFSIYHHELEKKKY